MTRPLRLQVPGGFYHVTSRGHNRREIYLDDEDRMAFLDQLKTSVVRFRWRCVSYCLMGNHYHLLLQIQSPNLSAGMRDLNGTYAQAFNVRHGTDSSLFKARYRSQLVQDDAYLLAAARYVALNPVRAGLVERAEQWPWSSYAGLKAGTDPDVVDPRPLLELLSPVESAARRSLAEMVEGQNALPAFDPAKAIVGDDDYVARHAPAQPPARPLERRAWEQARPPLNELVGTLPRDDFIRRARLELRYTLEEIAHALGCSTETIRRKLRMWDVGT